MTNPLNQARQSLERTLQWYGSFARHGRRPPSAELQGIAQPHLKRIKGAIAQLEHPLLRIAMFGLVSRGKSAVVNALLGQKRLLTSPINGETRYPQSVQWMVGDRVIELIDTPGLDEIEGQVRADMARDVASQADLILFVVAGDITRTEYQAMQTLRATQKPLILVFNKIDLYPDVEQAMIYQQLQQLQQVEPQNFIDEAAENSHPTAQNLVEDIILIAAEPSPFLVRHEWPDGSVTEDWETPEPAIAPLKTKLTQLLNQAGDALIALNALAQGQSATQSLAQQTIEHRQAEAEALIWQYAKWKAIAVAANPIAIVDIAAGLLTDLALIRALARLYGLPMTGFAAERLWRKIVFSSAMLTFGEIGGGIVLGMSKTTSLALDGGYPWGTWSMSAILQGGLAGYGSFAIGTVAQRYLEQGCTWGDRGISPTIESILNELDAPQIMTQLQQELLHR